MTEKVKLSREEIAAIEVGHTDISPAVAWFLTLTFFAIMFSMPLTQGIYEWRQLQAKTHVDTGQGRKWPQYFDVFGILPDTEELRGVIAAESFSTRFAAIRDITARMLRDINQFEDRLEDDSIIAQTEIPLIQSVLTGLLSAGNEQAYCGKDGWLFFRPGIDYITNRPFLDAGVLEERSRTGNEWTAPPQPNPLSAIMDFNSQLSERGIRLIVIPTPAKPMIYPEQFTRRYKGNDRPLQNPSFDKFRQTLEAEGVRVFDPAPILMAAKKVSTEPLYLDSDTHWTPEGINHVVRKLADVIRAEAVLTAVEPVTYGHQRLEVSNIGDIANMLNLPEDQTLYGLQTVTIDQVLSPDGGPWQPSKNAEILLLGDSFSNIYSLDGMNWGESAGLPEQLSAQLKRPLDRIVQNAGGSFSTRQQLSRELRGGNDRLAGKKLVVYQFAIRELAVGDWKLLDMTLGERKKPVPDVSGEGELIIRGKIGAVTSVPKPGTVPYKNCLTSIHLTDMKASQGKLAEDEIIIFVWGMRNNKWTKAAHYKPGRILNIKLKPWSEAEKKYGSYNRMELDDPDLLFLDTYWGQVINDSP